MKAASLRATDGSGDKYLERIRVEGIDFLQT
jgi:hypothetical protein